VIKLGELVMILDLHRQGLTVSAIARQLGIDRKTVRRYIERGLEPPTYGPRPRRPKRTDPFLPYLRERLAAYPGLTAVRLWRELRERGYVGGYTAVKRTVREIRPEPVKPFEIRFETPPGAQAQVDFARFEVVFTDEPGVTRIVWLFSMVLGFSRLIWARFVVHQDLQAVLRCHIAALEAIGGVPHEILYDRMKTAVIGEAGGSIVALSWKAKTPPLQAGFAVYYLSRGRLVGGVLCPSPQQPNAAPTKVRPLAVSRHEFHPGGGLSYRTTRFILRAVKVRMLPWVFLNTKSSLLANFSLPFRAARDATNL